MAQHNLSIEKIKNKWKVVDVTGKKETKAKRGDWVKWTPNGSNAYFQFIDRKLFGQWTRLVRDGQSLSLKVADNAKTGPNSYAVFCITDKKYAEGDSPPRIIIE